MLSRLRNGAEAPSHRLLRATLAILATFSISFSALAEQEININFAHRFSAKHYLWKQAGEVFANEVTQASKGRVTFDVYPAAQLGKDHFSLLKSGLVDIAIFIPSYESDKLPLSSVVELPGMYSTACEGANKYWKLARPGGMLGEGEFKKQGLHVLFVAVMPPYTLMTTRKPTPSLDSVSGLKIRSTGASMIKAAQALGAVPVQIPSSETYEALSRGTVDGAIFLYYGLPPYNLEDLTRYSVSGVNLGGGTIAFAISSKTWNSLPADIQDIMTQASRKTQASFCKSLDQDDLAIRQRIVKENQHVVVDLPPEEITRWNTRLERVTRDWIADMEGVGQDGSGALRAYSQASASEE